LTAVHFSTFSTPCSGNHKPDYIGAKIIPMQSDCLYSSLFFEHYNRFLLCE